MPTLVAARTRTPSCRSVRPPVKLSLVAMLAAMLSLATVCRAQETKDRWYIVEMLGQRAGWMHGTTQTEAETITTTAELLISIKRGPISMDIPMKSTFVETVDGRPVSMESVQKMGAMSMTQSYVFNDDNIELTTTQAGDPSKQTLSKPEGSWLPPAAAERYVLQRMRSGAPEIVVRVVDPFSGVKPITTTRTGFEKATIEAMGKKIEARKVVVEMSNIPGLKSVEYVDDEGELVRSETMLGGINLVMIASTKEEAMANMVAPEVMMSTFVKPDREIPNARRTTRAVYIASVPDGELPELPSTGSQAISKIDATSARVSIDTAFPHAALAEDVGNPALLAATATADSADAKVQELVVKALEKAGDDQADKAEALRSFVYRYIKKKSLDVGFASATEVARRAEGDCSEHGVLLAAMLRGAGIPSRVATGLIYVDEFGGGEHIFGYHMWAQAMLTIGGQPRWVDLDGTLPSGTPYDATHIALAVSNLEDGDAAGGLAGLVTLLGRLQIKVESVE